MTSQRNISLLKLLSCFNCVYKNCYMKLISKLRVFSTIAKNSRIFIRQTLCCSFQLQTQYSIQYSLVYVTMNVRPWDEPVFSPLSIFNNCVFRKHWDELMYLVGNQITLERQEENKLWLSKSFNKSTIVTITSNEGFVAGYSRYQFHISYRPSRVTPQVTVFIWMEKKTWLVPACLESLGLMQRTYDGSLDMRISISFARLDLNWVAAWKGRHKHDRG